MSRIDLKKKVEAAWLALPEKLRRLPVIVAVSAGMDSSVLAEISLRLRKRFCELHWVHLNYGLRLPAADREEAWLRDWAEREGVPLHIKKLKPRRKPANLQNWARGMRHQFLARIVAQHCGGDALVYLAHHQNDQAETVLLRMLRGSGLAGISGMSELETLGVGRERLRLFRPMLEQPREAVAQYARRRRIRYFEDASNRTPVYQRNRIRHQVLPRLAAENPRILETIASLARQAGGAVRFLTQIAERALARLHSKPRSLNLSRFRRLDRELQPYVLKAWLARLGISEQGWGRLIPQILKAAAKKVPAEILLKGSILLVTPSTLSQIKSPAVRPSRSQAKKPVTKLLRRIGKYRVSGFEGVLDLSLKKPDQLRQKSLRIVHLNPNISIFPLKLKKAVAGDRFQPFGLQGTKSVRRFLMDRKIPRQQRDVWLLTNAEGMPIWVIGHQIDERARVTNWQAPALRVEWVPKSRIP